MLTSAEQDRRGQGNGGGHQDDPQGRQGDAEGVALRLGQTAPNPTLSAIHHFEHEFTERLLPVATTKA
jgi:hypothetical protein